MTDEEVNAESKRITLLRKRRSVMLIARIENSPNMAWKESYLVMPNDLVAKKKEYDL